MIENFNDSDIKYLFGYSKKKNKIAKFFEYVNKEGVRLIAKMKSDKTVFDEDEIYKDFGILYKKYVRRNRKDLGLFFIKETEDIVNQLCDDFERTLRDI